MLATSFIITTIHIQLNFRRIFNKIAFLFLNYFKMFINNKALIKLNHLIKIEFINNKTFFKLSRVKLRFLSFNSRV